MYEFQINLIEPEYSGLVAVSTMYLFKLRVHNLGLYSQIMQVYKLVGKFMLLASTRMFL